MTATEIKQHIYILEPTEVKEIYSYCSVLIEENTHNVIREKNKQAISDYKNMINYIEDTMFVKLTTKSKNKELSFIRYCLYVYIQNELIEIEYNRRAGSTYIPLIAEIFNKDRTTVIHGIKTYEYEIAINKELQYIDTQIKAIIKEYKDKIYLTNIENQN